jgi:hypothetical protein
LRVSGPHPCFRRNAVLPTATGEQMSRRAPQVAKSGVGLTP